MSTVGQILPTLAIRNPIGDSFQPLNIVVKQRSVPTPQRDSAMKSCCLCLGVSSMVVGGIGFIGGVVSLTIAHVSSTIYFLTLGTSGGVCVTGVGAAGCSSRLGRPPKNVFTGTIVTPPQTSCWSRCCPSVRVGSESMPEPLLFQFPQDQPACPTCIDTQSVTADWAVLACGHAYHGICIDQQIQTLPPNTPPKCPECRTPFSDALISDIVLKSLLTDVALDFSYFLHANAQQQMWPFYARVKKTENWQVCLGSWDLLLVLEKINHLNQNPFSEETWVSLIGSARSVVSLLKGKPQLTAALVSACAGSDNVEPALRAIEKISKIKRSVARSYDVESRRLAFWEIEPKRKTIGIAFRTENVRFNHLAWRALALQTGIQRQTEIVPVMAVGSSIQEQPRTIP